MKLTVLISKLQKIAEKHPEARVYFTDENNWTTFETYLEDLYYDKESDELEFKFTTDERDGM